MKKKTPTIHERFFELWTELYYASARFVKLRLSYTDAWELTGRNSYTILGVTAEDWYFMGVKIEVRGYRYVE